MLSEGGNGEKACRKEGSWDYDKGRVMGKTELMRKVPHKLRDGMCA